MRDIYQAPEADLATPRSESGGKVDDALAGRFEFSALDTVATAWKNLYGFKASALLACLICVIALSALRHVTQSVVTPYELMQGLTGKTLALALALSLLQALVVGPLLAGVLLLGVRRAAQVQVRGLDVLNHYGKALPLLVIQMLPSLVSMPLMYADSKLLSIALGVLALYLNVSWMFASLLVVEKNFGVWQALETSRRVVSHCWFRLAGLLLLLLLLLVLGLLPFGIGLIWAAPLVVLALGTAYHHIFGYSDSA